MNKEVIIDIENPKDNDLISRQALLDVISKLNAISFYEEQEDSKECYYEIRNAIRQLQSVTPQPKMGRWDVTKEKDELYSNVCICSECGRSDVGAGDYCRWCGAKMQEVEKNEQKELSNM